VQDSNASGGAVFKTEGAPAGGSLLLSGNTNWTNAPDEGNVIFLDYNGAPVGFTGLYANTRNYVTLDYAGVQPLMTGLYANQRISSMQNNTGLYYVVLLNVFLNNAWPNGLLSGPFFTTIGGVDHSKRYIKTIPVSFDTNDLYVFTVSPDIIRYGQIFGMH
jgi:hypothetical protein